MRFRNGQPEGEQVSVGGALLSVRDLCIDHVSRDGTVRLVDSVSFEVRAGEVLGVAGESGSGKTLTALSAMRLLPGARMRVQGRVAFEGQDVLTMRREQLRQMRATRSQWYSRSRW